MAEHIAEILPPATTGRQKLPPALEANKWKPGQSGNPGGRTAAYKEAMQVCRQASPDAARRMVELMQSEDPRVAFMATNAILERAWGKPREYDPATDHEAKSQINVEKLSPEERDVLRKMLDKAASPEQG